MWQDKIKSYLNKSKSSSLVILGAMIVVVIEQGLQLANRFLGNYEGSFRMQKTFGAGSERIHIPL